MTDAEPTPIRGTECDDCGEAFLFRRHSVPDRCSDCRDRNGGRQVGIDGWSS